MSFFKNDFFLKHSILSTIRISYFSKFYHFHEISQFLAIFYHEEIPANLIKMISTAVILAILLVNVLSAHAAKSFSKYLFFIKLLVMVMIVILGLVSIFNSEIKISEIFKKSESNFLAYGTAFYNGLWSFDGWVCLFYFQDEIKEPAKNMQKILITSVALVTIMYFLVNFSYFTLLTPLQIVTSNMTCMTSIFKIDLDNMSHPAGPCTVVRS